MRFLTAFKLRTVLVCAACLVLVAVIRAALINPPDPSPQVPDPFSGCMQCTLVASLAPQTVLSSNSNWQATLTTAVFLDQAPVPGVRGGAGLDFVYQLQMPSSCAACTSGPDNIGRFTVSSFNTVPGLLVDIGVNFGSVPGFSFSFVTPGTVDRFVPGSAIGWSYTTPGSVPLTPGTTSSIMEIATNATHWTIGHAAAVDGGTANFQAFQPAP